MLAVLLSYYDITAVICSGRPTGAKLRQWFGFEVSTSRLDSLGGSFLVNIVPTAPSKDSLVAQFDLGEISSA